VNGETRKAIHKTPKCALSPLGVEMHRSDDGEEVCGWMRRKLASLFPRCQIHLRTDGRLRYVEIGHRLRLGLTALGALVIAWTIFATAQFAGQATALAVKDQQIDDTRVAYRALLAEVAAYQDRFYAVAQEFEENHNLMLDLVEQNAVLQRSLSSLHASLKNTEQERDREVAARDRLGGELMRVDDRLAEAVENNNRLRGRLATAQADLAAAVQKGDRASQARQVARARIELLEQQVSVLRGDLQNAVDARGQAVTQSAEQARQISALEDQLTRTIAARRDVSEQLHEQLALNRADTETLQASLLAALSDRDKMLFDQRRTGEHVRALEEQITSIQDLQQDAVQRLSDRAAQHIDSLEKVVGLTGLTVDTLLAGGSEQVSGQGGPFIAIDEEAPAEELPGERLLVSLNTLGQQIGHWESLQDVMRRIPIAAPLKTYHLSSDYGKRLDPLNKRWAMHYGVDLVGPADSPVLATAPGVVAFAGWKERYGRVVEIDHGTGIVTRYAHLDSIEVKSGQRVAFQLPLGVLGNSGRSTGAHLHYEVIFKTKPMDPMRFIKAGQYVFQDSQGTR